jgi:anti-sigma factor RsiW
MKNEDHLNEQALNMYLDGELSAGELERARAHLATCDACRMELSALQSLFDALDELAPVLAPDLAPGVLAQLPRPMRRPWRLALALQTVAMLAWLTWGAARLTGYWPAAVEFLSSLAPEQTWISVVDWAAAQWTTLLEWSGLIGDTFQEWTAHTSDLGDLYLSLTQLVVLGAVILALWLVGNTLFLRRILVNGQT